MAKRTSKATDSVKRPAEKPAERVARRKKAAQETAAKIVKETATKSRRKKTDRATVADSKPIRQHNARPGLPEGFDLTIENAYISITSPRTGETKYFWIRRQLPGEFMEGQRIAYVFRDGNLDPDDLRSWKGFAWTTDCGLQVFKSCVGFAKRSIYERYADMLERMSHYHALGCVYAVTPIK